jgi:sulfhydrogenase subunit beta (sulfur reductase)
VEAKVISKENLAQWLKSLTDKLDVVAPVTEDGVTRFRTIDDPATIDLDTLKVKSLRDQFTPETETLFEYVLGGHKAELKAAETQPKDRLIFGARACDAAALRYIDAVYSMVQPRDEPYFDRREHTIIAGVFCSSPAWSCFCTAVGDFLMNPVEMDVYFTDIGGKYYVQAFTSKGEGLLGAAQFGPATEADAQAAEDVRRKAISRLPAKTDHAEACLSYDWEHPIWAKLSQKCLGCGVCAFLCPTCHCFDIQECPQGKKGSRFRCWDTCQFEKFTLMGHGHNPRPSRQERTRQRVFHKFKYSQERYGMLGCVGCGRCVAACPVNIDIRQIIAELEKCPAADG